MKIVFSYDISFEYLLNESFRLDHWPPAVQDGGHCHQGWQGAQTRTGRQRQHQVRRFLNFFLSKKIV